MRCRASISSCQWFAICVGSSDRRRATRKAASIIVSIRPVGVGARIRVRRRPARRTISIMIIRPRLKWTVCVRQWRVWPKWTSWAAIEQQKAALTHSLTQTTQESYLSFIYHQQETKKTYAFGAISPSSYDCCSVVGDDVFIMMQTYYPPINSCRSIRLSLSPSLLNITQTKVADTECIVVETHHKQTCTHLTALDRRLL